MKRRNIIYNGYRGHTQGENHSMIMIATFKDYLQHMANAVARDETSDVLMHHRITECKDPEYIQDSDGEMAIYILSSRDNLDFRQRFGQDDAGRN